FDHIPLVQHVLERALRIGDGSNGIDDGVNRITVLTSEKLLNEVKAMIDGHCRYEQEIREGRIQVKVLAQNVPSRRGTAALVLDALKELELAAGEILILLGDVPLVPLDDLLQIIALRRKSGLSGAILGVTRHDPVGYGRLDLQDVENDGPKGGEAYVVRRIIEEKQVSSDFPAGAFRFAGEKTVNVGAFVFDVAKLRAPLECVVARPEGSFPEQDPANRCWYLTDVVDVLFQRGIPVRALISDDEISTTGFNSVLVLNNLEQEIIRLDRVVQNLRLSSIWRETYETGMSQRSVAHTYGLKATDDKCLGVVDYSVRYRPCGARIGGDFYGIEQRPNSALVGVLGDAMGHGLLAAIRMIPMLARFKTACETARSTLELLCKIEEVHLKARRESEFGTAMCFELDWLDGTLHLFASSLGHDPFLMYLSKRDEVHSFPEHIGHAIGVPADGRVVEDITKLSVGDVIVGWTDGVSEAGCKRRQDRFGKLGVTKALLAVVHEEPAVIADAIVEAALRHAENEQHDDVTVIVMKVLKVNARDDGG
ncbi:MAG: SpoIIE family protein phosphatase, partial [Planctomycetota bacterium]|nr:SpoIIE family protein phosphatase [Planctomycetota bacterium]